MEKLWQQDPTPFLFVFDLFNFILFLSALVYAGGK
jgi:hypothetical protein